VNEPLSSRGVVGQQAREPEAAREIERRLHRFAHARLALVRPKKRDGRSMNLASDARLERNHERA
jgi:hypothetical protein